MDAACREGVYKGKYAAILRLEPCSTPAIYMQICCTGSAAHRRQGFDHCCLDLQHNTVRLINYATALYFAMDMLLRCIADGVLFTPSAYLLVSNYRTHSAFTLDASAAGSNLTLQPMCRHWCRKCTICWT